VLLEAMALGVPVVSTAVMGTREVLADGRGSLIAEEDEQVFAQRCVQVLTDPALRACKAVEARAYAQTWSAPRLAQQLRGFYREVLDARRTDCNAVEAGKAECPGNE
jgi:glycosyltransferase involved in cell wall biosynthesis